MRYMLEPVIKGLATLPEGSLDRIREWLEASNVKPENVPSTGAYVVRAHAEDRWYLVARRYVRDVNGKKIRTRMNDAYQKTIYITTEVGTPPDFVLAQGDRK